MPHNLQVSAYCYVCVLILLYVCPHTTKCVSAVDAGQVRGGPPANLLLLYFFLTALLLVYCRCWSRAWRHTRQKNLTVLLPFYCFCTASLLLYCSSLFTADVGEARGGGRAGAEGRVWGGVWRQGGDTKAPRHVRAQRQQVAFLEGTASLQLLTALLRLYCFLLLYCELRGSKLHFWNVQR
jgi:hypothetical protein